MNRIALSAALGLVLGLGGAAQAACIATNCSIDEQLKTSPTSGGDASSGDAMTPQLEKDLKELSSATVHALGSDADHPAAPNAGTPPADAKR